MSVVSPIIDRWIQQGLKQGRDWSYFQAIKLRPFVLRAGQMWPMPENDGVLLTPHGTLISAFTFFSSPDCGIRWESTDLDLGDGLTVNATALAAHKPNVYLYAPSYGNIVFLEGVPMRLYALLPAVKEWVWTDWLRLHLFNKGVTDAYCIAYILYGAKILLSKKRYYEKMGWDYEEGLE